MHIHGLWNDFEKGIAKVSSVRIFSIYNKDFQWWMVGERRHMESAQTLIFPNECLSWKKKHRFSDL